MTKRGKCLGREFQNHVDPGRDGFSDHLEVSRLHSAWATTRLASSIPWPTTNNYQQADTGTKMIHIGKNTKSTIVSKGISAGHGQNTYRGLVKIRKGRDGRAQLLAVRFTAHGRPVRRAHVSRISRSRTRPRSVEHEASTSKIGEDQIFYCRQRGLSTEDAINMIVSGFCKEVFRQLPMEFAVEAQKLLSVTLEGSVG